MKSNILLALTAIIMISCKPNLQEKTFKVFNEGVSLNLKSIEEQDKGNYEKAISLNKQSIEKFKETLKLDPKHQLAYGALGHSLYVNGQFEEAINWLEKAIKIDSKSASNFREIGLSKINLGEIKDGKNDIDKAFKIDTSAQIRKLTIDDLYDISKLAIQYSENFTKAAEQEKSKDYKKFAVGVLATAFEYDRSRKDIALKIAELTNSLGDKETSNKFEAYAKP